MSANLPTADDVAWAIVTASREMGEDPIGCATGATARWGRHYAMHALRHVFPDLSGERAALLCGCPGKPVYFWNNSVNQVAYRFKLTEQESLKRFGEPVRTRAAKWWNEDAYNRVIAAIIKSADGQPITVAQRPAPRPRQTVAARVPIDSRRIGTRIDPVPLSRCSDVTAGFMGDPPHARSALAEAQDVARREATVE
jgi:hypothetical protein